MSTGVCCQCHDDILNETFRKHREQGEYCSLSCLSSSRVNPPKKLRKKKEEV